MAAVSTPAEADVDDGGLRRSITGRQLFFYTLGDVLGSGIYVLIGLVAAAVGGAFWIAFAVGVSVAAITGTAYAELVTKYPQAAGAALYVNKAFGNKALTFLITVSFLSASFAAAGSLATGFSQYFAELFSSAPALVVSLLFIAALSIVNFIGITESVVINMAMAFIEIVGLLIVMFIGIWYVAEETIDPHKSFPRSLIGGMLTAGVIYVLVSMAAALTVPTDKLAGSDAALLEVVKAGILPFAGDWMITLFTIIALVAITNTTLVVVVTQPRILYGMANEDVVPGVFARIHSTRRSPWVGLLFSAVVVCSLLVIGTLLTEAGAGLDLVARLATVTVVFLLFIYALVIVAALKLGGQDEDERTFKANRPLLVVGLLGNLAILVWSIQDDPSSLLWCAGLVALGVVLYLIEKVFGSRTRPPGAASGDPAAANVKGV